MEAIEEHPEALATPGGAAALVKAVRSGRLTVGAAYRRCFSRPLASGRPRDARALRADLLDGLVAFACRLPPREVALLAGEITSTYDRLENRTSPSEPAHEAVFRDLLVAGELLAGRDDVDPREPAVRALLASLTEHACRYSGEVAWITDFARRCCDLTARCRCRDAALRYVEQLAGWGPLADRGAPADDARHTLALHLRHAVACIAASHPEALEARLARTFRGRPEPGARAALLPLLEGLGGRPSLDALLDQVEDPALAGAHPHFRFAFWGAVLRIARRLGFEPDVIRGINERVSRVVPVARIMVSYHAALGYFAECLAQEGVDLYRTLEGGGVQFWDYWMVYHRSTAASPGSRPDEGTRRAPGR